jgi:hypothetical protein
MSNFSAAQKRFYNDVMDNNTLEELNDFLSGQSDPWVLKEYGITEGEYFGVLEACYENWD